MSTGLPPLLSVCGLTKRFGGLTAVNKVDFALWPGEILGLIGPNGSGKSTLVKLLMGIEQPSDGSIRFDGAEIAGLSTHLVARRGIGIVFQHSRPLERQTVIETILLGLLPDSLFHLSISAEHRARARAIAEKVGLGAVLDRRPSTLSFADLRRLELAKALARDPKVLLIDEPFAGLTASECAEFSALFREQRSQGKAILLVDHNVRTVAALVDRVIALCLGERIAEGKPVDVMRNEAVRRVYLGGAIEASPRNGSGGAGAAPLLELRDVGVRYGKALAVDQANLTVGENEFVSLVGINGAGKTSLFNAITGFVPYSGEILWRGQPVKGLSAVRVARLGISHCPETRELFGDMSVRENLDLGGQRRSKAESDDRLDWMFELFPILKSRQKQNASTLSGGEQQMLAIARALMTDPQLLILDEPTLGLAPIILEQLSKALDALRQTGKVGVLLGEQNVTFALPHADRIHVMDRGRMTWQGSPDRFVHEAGAKYLL